TRRPPSSPLFPYTTLFRSHPAHLWTGIYLERLADGRPALPGDTAGCAHLEDGPAHSRSHHRRRCHGRTVRRNQRHRLRLGGQTRSEEHTSELQSLTNIVCR